MYKDIGYFNSDDTNVDAIRNSIYNILMTRRGSVPGKPNFGSDIYKIIFSQIDTLTEIMLKRYVIDAIEEFEDRIEVKDVIIKKIPEYNKLSLDLIYRYTDKNFNEQYENVTITFNL